MPDVDVPLPANRFFCIAVKTGVENAVRLHIERGDEVNARDGNGYTLLMLAASRNKATICRLLLDAMADPYLLNPAGLDALTIARLEGAIDACQAIQQHIDAAHGMSDSVSGDVLGSAPPEAVPSPAAVCGEIVAVGNENELIDEFDAPIDLSVWMADDDGPAPEGDLSLAISSTVLHLAISEHSVVDSSAAWDEFDIDLPSFATPLLRIDDVENRDQLRRLFLRATREGSVPSQLIEDVCRHDDRSRNLEKEAILQRLVNDIGAEHDERFEYVTDFEDFRVTLDALESENESSSVDEALSYFDSIVTADEISPYLLKVRQEYLLTAADEINLGRLMEETIESAMDALAAWPDGLAALVEDMRLVRAGSKPLRWMFSEPQDEEPIGLNESSGDNVTIEVEKADLDEIAESASELASSAVGDLTFLISKISELTQLPASNVIKDHNWAPIRKALETLSLQRSYLISFLDLHRLALHASKKAYAKAITDHKKARDRMTVANLRLVLSLAKRYFNSGMPMDDLIQEGNVGLLKGVERFDWRKGYKFSTYATWWIRQQISRAVADKSRTIRLPVYFYQAALAVKHAADSWEAEHGTFPSFSQLGKALKLPTWKIEAALRETEPFVQLDADNIDELISLDSKSQFVSPDPSDMAESAQLREIVRNLVDGLKNKEGKVIRLRFGIGCSEEFTLEEVGSMLNVTRERVRQIEAKALRILRHPARSAVVVDWNPQTSAPDGGETEGNASESDGATSSDEHRPDPLRSQVDAVTATSGELESPTLNATLAKRDSITNALTHPLVPQPQRRKSSALNRLLDEARAMGYNVGPPNSPTASGSISVSIHQAKDSKTRSLTRKLIKHGFTYSIGEGYTR